MKIINYGYPDTTFTWWESKRIIYNTGLVISGITAFICYCAVFEILSDEIVNKTVQNGGDSSEVEITLFTTLIQGLGYLVAMAIANICYFLGPVSEKIIKPSDPERYRKLAYNLGFWCSFALPFGIPLTVMIIYS